MSMYGVTVSIPIQVRAKYISRDGFVWLVTDEVSGMYAEVDPRSGEVLIRSPGTMPDEMVAVIGAMCEWCHTDARNFAGANRKKVQTVLNYKATTF